jgi:hypothetical protein
LRQQHQQVAELQPNAAAGLQVDSRHNTARSRKTWQCIDGRDTIWNYIMVTLCQQQAALAPFSSTGSHSGQSPSPPESATQRPGVLTYSLVSTALHACNATLVDLNLSGVVWHGDISLFAFHQSALHTVGAQQRMSSNTYWAQQRVHRAYTCCSCWQICPMSVHSRHQLSS